MDICQRIKKKTGRVPTDQTGNSSSVKIITVMDYKSLNKIRIPLLIWIYKRINRKFDEEWDVYRALKYSPQNTKL